MQEYNYYVGGEFRKSKDQISVINPATEEVFAKIFDTTEKDLTLALEKAKAAQRQWKKTSFKERAKSLREIAQAITDNLSTLAQLESKEIGKPQKETLFVDIPLAADCFNHYASFLDSLEEESFQSELGIDLVQYDPFGVVGVFLPYNTPLMILGFSCAAALAAGNALIIKPAHDASLSVLELARYIDLCDIPKGLISVVSGRGSTVGSALAKSDIDLITFTGSRDTLKKIIASSAENPKKLVCELGGCNLNVIFSDANKEDAIQNVLGSSFMKQGQMCIGTSVVLVQDDCYDEIVKNLVEKTSQIKTGDPFSPDNGLGALISKEYLEEVHDRVKKLKAKGAKVLCGGERIPGKGYFYPPTIIEVDQMMYEEFFAPVILVKRFKDMAEAERVVGENPTGLVLQIWTQDLDKAKNLAQTANCGTIWINTFAQMNSQTPFGGAGKSGWGRNLGKFGFFEYVQPKHIGIGLKRSPVWGWFGV